MQGRVLAGLRKLHNYGPSRRCLSTAVNRKPANPPIEVASEPGELKRMNLFTAINDAMRVAMMTDDSAIVFGEDVGFGGVFRCSVGLLLQLRILFIISSWPPVVLASLGFRPLQPT